MRLADQGVSDLSSQLYLFLVTHSFNNLEPL
jgi:hypothetical protein